MLIYIFSQELLIDFRELVGEDSSENMAEAVWVTMELYRLAGRVRHHVFLTFIGMVLHCNITVNCNRHGQCKEQ